MSTIIDLPYDLWSQIITYTNDIITCKNLYSILPDDTQKNIYRIYYKHICSLSINIIYSNIHTVSVYKNNSLYKDVLHLDKIIRLVKFRPHSNEFCTALINGEIIFWNRQSFEKIRTIQVPQYFIDQLEFHPDGTKMITVSGPQIKLWSINTSTVSILNSTSFVYPLQTICVHHSKPIVYLARIFNNKLIQVYQWDYQYSTIFLLPLHMMDEYISAEFLLEEVYTDPIIQPIHFSVHKNNIEGFCCGHIKTVDLEDSQKPTVVYRTNQPHIFDFIWNSNRTLLYYSYYDYNNHYSCIRTFNGPIFYISAFHITKLLGLVENETKLLIIDNQSICLIDIQTSNKETLFDFFSTNIAVELA